MPEILDMDVAKLKMLRTIEILAESANEFFLLSALEFASAAVESASSVLLSHEF